MSRLLLSLAITALPGCFLKPSTPRPAPEIAELTCETSDADTARADARVLEARLSAGGVRASVEPTPEHGLRVTLLDGALEPPLPTWLHPGVLALSPVAEDQSPLGAPEALVGTADALRPALAALSLPEDRAARLACDEESPPSCRALLVEVPTTLRPEIVDTSVEQTEWGPLAVAVSFDETSAAAFEELTGRLVQRRLAIVLDDTVLASPTVMERIAGGKVHISLGAQAKEPEARRMAALLSSGPLRCGWTLRALR